MDTAGQRVLVVGFTGTTVSAWSFQGLRWRPVAQAPSPADPTYFAAAFDESRRRVVVWGGSTAGTAQLAVWECDGTAWTSVAVAAGPTGRDEPAMAYDGTRNSIIMFGGRDVASGQPLADTWTWNGSVWTRLTPLAAPPARSGHSMTWDPVRRRVVLFGGDSGTPRADTWEWDGTNWTSVATAVTPPARTGHGAAFDPQRNRVVIACGEGASGLTGDTWEFDGANWAIRQATEAPPPLREHAAAFDAARREVVLFGGHVQFVSSAETWRFKNGGWTKLQPTAAPTARSAHAMTFDAAQGRIILFGGLDTGVARDDTWSWDGNTWTLATPAHRPPARWSHAMTYDAARGRVVLFGGLGTSQVFLSDTWEWDGNDWQQRMPATSPPARAEAGLAFDAARNEVLLHSGRFYANNVTTYLTDTWTYDGVTWTLRSSSTPGLPARAGCAMTYDAATQTVLAFGGKNSATYYPYPQLQAWNGNVWSAVTTPAPAPSPRAHASATWDVDRRHLVCFGGEAGSSRFGETWVFSRNPVAGVRPLPPETDCQGSILPYILASGLGVVGNANYALDFWHQDPPTPTAPVVFLVSTNTAMTGVRLGTCQLTVDPATLFHSAATTRTGTLATLPLPVPEVPSLMGLQFIAQGLTLDPTNAALNGLALSLGARIGIGDF
ncbi:MAG: kelch repeat-containing protein [Planctomycetota bacterium]